MNTHLPRALVLMDQGRLDLAEGELRQALGEEPNEPLALALLAICLVRREQFDDAQQAAEDAIRGGPDLPLAHRALGIVLQSRNRLPEAEVAFLEAVRLDPGDPNNLALLAGIRLALHRWPSALDAAEQGLRLDAEHVECNNFRAMALVKLGRKQEAAQTIDATLANDPENSDSHANRGWAYLEQDNPKKALEHFRESLRLDPNSDWARAGLVEALKARHLIYRVMLWYFLFMAKLSGRAQWIIVLGGYFLYRILLALADANDAVRPFIMPVIIAYIAFALLTWLSGPLFNLFLFLNRYGRYALNRDQRYGAMLTGVCVLIALGGLVYGFVEDEMGYLWALVFCSLSMPVASIFVCPAGWPRWLMAAIVAGLLALGIFGLLPGLTRWIAQKDALYAFFWGVLLSQFAANLLRGVRVVR